MAPSQELQFLTGRGHLEQRLLLAQKNLLLLHHSRLALLQSRFMAQSPQPRLQQLQRDAQQWRYRLEASMQQRLQQAGSGIWAGRRTVAWCGALRRMHRRKPGQKCCQR